MNDKTLQYHDGRVDPLPPPTEAPPQPAAAVPAEFDALLTRTADHAAAQAILCALRREQIESHCSDDGRATRREIILHVRSSDLDNARLIAAEIFVRRKKFKEMPKVEQPSSDGLIPRSTSDAVWIDCNWPSIL